MSVSAISRRYAKALVRLAEEQNQLERFGQELQQFTELLTSHGQLRSLLESPTFPMGRKEAILGGLLDRLEPAPTIRNFLGLLLAKDRLQLLPQMQADFRQLADEIAGVVRARVTSAAKLDDRQRQAIEGGLSAQTGKQVELSVRLAPELIGGLQAEIGGRLFDGSLKTQLKRFEDTLKKG